MRLKKSQKEAVIRWIAEGLQSDEVNERGAEFFPPFSVSRQQVDYYRKTREADIKAIVAAGELDALTEGLAVKAERVKKLKQLAALLERDLFGGFLWLDQVKGVGSGDIAKIVDYEEFNRGEVEAYRGVLDDIAKELGHRVQRQDVTTKGESLNVRHTDEQHALAMVSILDAFGAGLLRPGGNGNGAMDATERTTSSSGVVPGR